MIKMIHVRGTIAPTSNFQTNFLPKLRDALEEASLNDFTGYREISEKGQILFNRSYSENERNPDLSGLVKRLQKFLRSKEMKGISMYGTMMMIMETNDDFPKLYRITVERGTVAYKEATVTWNSPS